MTADIGTLGQALTSDSRADLRRTKTWLYVIVAFCVLVLLVTSYGSLPSKIRMAALVLILPPMAAMVSCARAFGRFERGSTAALLVAVRRLRALWILLTFGALVPTAAMAYRLARHFLQLT